VDTLLFRYIPDDSVRMAALESGDVDITWGTHEAYDRLKAHPDLKVQIEKPGVKFVTALNKQKGLFAKMKLRQAVLAALDMEPILRAAVGHPQFYRLDSSLSHKEEPWWTDAGGELYNQNNPEKARRLLKEAGYRGEPVRYMAAYDAVAQHRVAPATKQQLEAVGFTVELQLMEWSTLARLRRNPDLWDAHTV
jgi:peptide/nickel transport system substrate-binding protein